MGKDAKDNENKELDYVEGYRVTIWIMSAFIILGGIIVGIEKDSINYGLVGICWASGGILILILNLLKDIINELRILNSKIK